MTTVSEPVFSPRASSGLLSGSVTVTVETSAQAMWLSVVAPGSILRTPAR
ncbi:hypothetical protein ACQ86D_32020 [Streptomyces galilaeus]